MHPRFVLSSAALALAASAFPAGLAIAQQRSQPAHATAIDVTPYAGYMMFGTFIDGPVGTSLRSSSSPLYGAELGIALSPNLSIVGNVGYASSDLEVGVPILGGLDVGSSKVLMYDGGLRLKLPLASSTGIKPYVQAGVGAMRYDVKTSIFSTQATNTAFNFGGGLEYQLSPALGIQLSAKDFVGKFDFEDATGFDFSGKTTHNVALSVGVRLGFK